MWVIFPVVVLIVTVNFFLEAVTIFEYEKGLKYVNGRFKKILVPGRYWILRHYSTIIKVDIRPRFATTAGQEVLSLDGVTLKASVVALYEVADPYAAVARIAVENTATPKINEKLLKYAVGKHQDYHQALYLLLQLSLREIIGSANIDELLEKRNRFRDMLITLTSPKAEAIGLKLLDANIKDIMFPGDLKKIFAQVVKARKEGLAALEKARGETAALRHLANAAKMIEDNPNLMPLRVLQTIGESPGSTLMLGLPSNVMPLPLAGKARNKETGAEEPGR